MKRSEQTEAQVGEVLDDIVKAFPGDSENKLMTDLSFQARPETGELFVYNDDDEVIASATIDEWIDFQGDDFQDNVRETLRQAIHARKNELDNLSLLKPYSFIQVDNQKETLCELYLVDDNTVLLDHDELMKGLDKDLGSFLDKLLKD